MIMCEQVNKYIVDKPLEEYFTALPLTRQPIKECGSQRN